MDYCACLSANVCLFGAGGGVVASMGLGTLATLLIPVPFSSLDTAAVDCHIVLNNVSAKRNTMNGV